MTILPIRLLGDPVLREPCRDVESFDRSLRTLYDDMLETMYEAPGVGLAAPQVGLSLRFFVYDGEKGSGAGGVANPVIVEAEGELQEEEGCLSIPELWAPAARAKRVVLRGLDLRGKAVELEGEDLLARIFQHETDHLNGTLFIDRLDREDRKQMMAKLRDRELSGHAAARSRETGPGRGPRGRTGPSRPARGE